MTDLSKFVIRWVLEDAAAIIKTGKAYSGEYPIGDFVWSVGLEESADYDEANVTLRCDVDHCRPWKCAGDVEVFWLQTTGKYELVGEDTFSFNEANKSNLILYAGVNWSTLMFQAGVPEHKITLKLRITITNSTSSSTSFFQNFKSLSSTSINSEASSNEVNSTTLVTDYKSTSLDKRSLSSSNEVNNVAVATDVKSTLIGKVDGSSQNDVNSTTLVDDDTSAPIFDIKSVSSPTEVRQVTLGAGDESAPIPDDPPPNEVSTVTLGAGDASRPSPHKAHVPPPNEVSTVTLGAGDASSPTTNFSSPNASSNIILVAGYNKVNVSKDYLAIHSPVFSAMFFGDSVEKEKEEVEIEDVVYEEFLDLLHLIFPGATKITDGTLVHILKLASRFQMEGVMQLSEEYLMQSKGFDATTKMLLADQYGLILIRENWLQSFNSVADVLEKLSSPEAADFSGDMKIAICNRIMELNSQ